MTVSDFIRLYHMRAPKLMWFLGAGTSASAGIPTASHLIWRFKQMIFCSEQRKSLNACSDLGDPLLRARIQGYFDDKKVYPEGGSDDEYAHYFEVAYPDEKDRQRYIRDMVSSAHTSYGHIALAALMKLEMVRLVWTTNFDSLIEDAAAEVFGNTGSLTAGSPDAPRIVTDALLDERFPILIKLHGDFRSRRLKNTPEELRLQDIELRKSLVNACRHYGLIVAGYSGRDHSIMETLMEVVEATPAFPQGFFWFQRPGESCLPVVRDLIRHLCRKGIEAEIIDLNTFDELMSDILLLVQDMPDELQAHLAGRKTRISDIPLLHGKGTWPVLRMNALAIISSPVVCRRISCKIGGAKEVRQVLRNKKAVLIAGRRKDGAIAFGSDAEIARVFGDFDITELDLHTIERKRLQYESVEHGMLYEALCRALERERPLQIHHKRYGYFAAVHSQESSDHILAPLRKTVRELTGVLKGSALKWAEAIRIHLEYRLDNLWLLVEPTIWIEETDNDLAFKEGHDFVKSRLATRYNAVWNSVIAAWANIISNGENESSITAFGINDGCDATFVISGVTAFSRRWQG